MCAALLFAAAAACAAMSLYLALRRKRYRVTWRRGGVPLYQRCHLARASEPLRRCRKAVR